MAACLSVFQCKQYIVSYRITFSISTVCNQTHGSLNNSVLITVINHTWCPSNKLLYVHRHKHVSVDELSAYNVLLSLVLYLQIRAVCNSKSWSHIVQ